MAGGSEDRLVEEIYDALDRQEPETALALARGALDGSDGEDPVLRFLAGVALLEMDHPEEAAEQLRRASGLDPEDAEFRSNLSLALFRSCRFAEAEAEAHRALQSDPGMPDAHVVVALVLERQWRLHDADEHLRRAEKLDPERFPYPVRLHRGAFREEAVRAGERLPVEFRRHLAQVAVTLEDLPSDAILTDEDPPLDPELLGLFVGTALPDRSLSGSTGELPPRILLFKRNIERYARDAEHLREEIAVTLYHELGHYLGLGEEELERIDLA